MTSALLDAKGVTLQYKTPRHLVTATYRVDFSVHQGDRYVILGPSGCGKSTLLKAVGGFMPPTEGSIRIREREIRSPGPDRMMVFQEFEQLMPWKTAYQNVIFPMKVTRKFASSEAAERADAAIAKVGLTEFRDIYPHMLSGGMKMRVAIARAMALEPDILLMDEPFAALDALTRRTMQQELLSLWDQLRFTVLFVTHSIEEAIIIGSRILVLSPHPGRVRAELDASGLDHNSIGTPEFGALSQRIHALLFGNAIRTRCQSVNPQQTPPQRPELEVELADTAVIGDVERPLTLYERIASNDAVQRLTILVALIVVWEIYARWLNNSLLFPTFSETIRTFGKDIANGVLIDRTFTSLRTLAIGYAFGLAFAAVFTTMAVASGAGTRILSTLTAMFNPLPAIALLPLALIWFGLGTPSLVFVIIHSVLWAVALNTLSGFRSVPETLRMSGRNVGLTGARYVALILIPAAFPSILAGLKIGWAFAWRTLVAAELVFGVSARSGGIGWYIFEARNDLNTATVFSGLLTVILIGLAVESVIFRAIEARTVNLWGMQR